MNLLVLGHFIFMLSIVRESKLGKIVIKIILRCAGSGLQIKCYSCVDHGKQHGSNMPLPGFQEFRMPNNSDAEFPDIPSKPCGKLGKDSMVNCPGASVTCYKIVRGMLFCCLIRLH